MSDQIKFEIGVVKLHSTANFVEDPYTKLDFVS